MMRAIGCILLLLFGLATTAQTKFSDLETLIISSTTDSIQISDVSISPVNFKVLAKDTLVPPKNYNIDFGKATLYIDSKKFKKITIEYTPYPEFLTKTYAVFDKDLILASGSKSLTPYSLQKSNRDNTSYKPFEGLYTQGSISRGITIGNNQDAVLNSSLDLQISGKLSDKVTIRASITDSNIPIQENGYSQSAEEFDRVFIELFTDYWSVQAGDIELNNTESHYMRFNKKVSGISVDAKLGDEDAQTDIKASGALVRGQYTRQSFTALEGNQGPYRLTGPNGELNIIVLSGSETIYSNGIPLKRGFENDYVIDYNTAEITFNTTYPVTANMRFTAEFQYSDKNYTRFITYEKVHHTSEKLQIGGYYYNESDSKNQPLQQNLTEEQMEILANAGNDRSKMVAPSASPEAYDENKIQYKKVIIDGIETYEFSQNPDDELYNVTFNFVENRGSYQLEENTAIGKIYSYVGENLGDYIPLIILVAPTQLQIAAANADYKPNSRTTLKGEIALSNNDQNLFSSIDDENNDGVASKIGWEQIISNKSWLLKTNVNFDYINENFKSIERIYNIEFNRDWGLVSSSSENQTLLNTEILLSNKKDKQLSYLFETLNLGDSFKGNKHSLYTDLHFQKTWFNSYTSILESTNNIEKNSFIRGNISVLQDLDKIWIGANLNSENNQKRNTITQKLDSLTSQQFVEYETYTGVGDTTQVYSKVGIKFRVNDSIRNNTLTKVNKARNIYFKSRIVQNKNAQVNIFSNYRTVNNTYFENEASLNSRVTYSQKLLKNSISWNTLFETSSGSLPQQEFAYIKTEPGQGFYAWIDYNNNGIQEFDEFEIAKFPDQAEYLRIVLPSSNYTKINQSKFSQSLQLNANLWKNKKGFQKVISNFSNQSYLLIDNKKEQNGTNFNFNPFETNSENVLGLIYNLKNSLFFRRGMQNYSTTYTYSSSQVKNDLGIGTQIGDIKLQELQFQHKLGFYWLIDLKGIHTVSTNASENFPDRDYKITSNEIKPIITFNRTTNSSFDLNYEYKAKEEAYQLATLNLQKLGLAYQFSHPEKGAIIADINFYKNDFFGDENSSIAYQMLEGLQPGNNFTWNLLVQKKITTYLHLNLNYSGRKSNDTRTIHTGNVQIRANF